MKHKRNILALRALVILCFPLLLTNCAKDSNNNLGIGQKAVIDVAISAVSFGEIVEINNNRAATPFDQDFSLENGFQQNTVDLDNDMLMVAELIPESGTSTPATHASLKDASKAATEIDDLSPNIRYRVLVFNAEGVYVTARDYTRGNEAATAALELDGGSEYTFVVYSVNSTSTILPTISPTNTTQRTLSNTTIALTGTQDYMYFRQTLTVTGGVTNRLDIVLKHRLSQITTVIDASETGYNVTAVSSNFSPHLPQGVASMETGNVTRTGTTTTSAVTFSSVGTATVTSVPTIINADVSNGVSYTLTSITVGPLTQTALIPFSTLTVTPGVRYTLRLRIVPTDEILTHEGSPAARINGDIWAAHNLGADESLPANPTTMSSGYFGNYYQWGRPAIIAAPTATVVNSNWTSASSAANPTNDAWNAGTESDPIKGHADPCPEGYRVPTNIELARLISSTTHERIGNFSESNTNYGAGYVLTSRRKSNVKITFPMQGWFFASSSGSSYTAQSLTWRGRAGWNWSSYMPVRVQVSLLDFDSVEDPKISTRPSSDGANTRIGHNLRCIGIQL